MNCRRECIGYTTYVISWSELGNKNTFAKKSERNEENSSPQTNNFLGFAKRFSEFAKRFYETYDRNFFNLAIIIVVVVFSIVKFIFNFTFR